MKKIFLLSLFLNVLYSQNKIHITESEFNKISATIIQDPNSNSEIVQSLIKKLETSDNIAIQSYAYIAKSFSYISDLDADKFQKNIKTAKRLIKNAPKNNFSKRIESSLLNFEGVFFKMNNEKENALFKFIEARNLTFEISDYNTMIGINANIAKLYQSIENFEKAISITKENIANLKKYESYIDPKNIKYKLCINYANLGNFYSQKFKKTNNRKYLDSAINIYKKAIPYDDPNLKVEVNMSIGNLFSSKGEFEKAKFYYLSVETDAKNDIQLYTALKSNLAYANFEIKDYKNAIKNCKSIDSIYNSKKDIVISEYVFSNYLQSKIYERLNEKDKMLHHAKIHIDFKNIQKEVINDETERINSLLKLIDKDNGFKNKINEIENSNRAKIVVLILIFIVLNTLIFYYLYKKYKTKKTEVTKGKEKNNAQPREIQLDHEKENIILSKIKQLEAEKFYLIQNFNQKELAKKINTNTTYLSYVFNKNYEQNFNIYYNDLRINHAIEQMIHDKRYREYSTFGIAESVGFKNADSFTTAFKKKTGKTPYQYVIELKK